MFYAPALKVGGVEKFQEAARPCRTDAVGGSFSRFFFDKVFQRDAPEFGYARFAERIDAVLRHYQPLFNEPFQRGHVHALFDEHFSCPAGIEGVEEGNEHHIVYHEGKCLLFPFIVIP
ncbi:hypothetical protein SDC9_115724 [bioreactor metagenome]|uniref:Uncharacterized protein n=1 Tax=bioreactor metagenome TaxID=1076179 RepID=A0A645BTP4_9ZZZZ